MYKTAQLLGVSSIKQNSPAVNAGDPDGCRDHLGQLIDADQRGIARYGRCDIGAFEWTPPGATTIIFPLNSERQRTLPTKPFAEPLKVIALDASGNLTPDAQIDFIAPASGASAIFSDTHSYTATFITDEAGFVAAALSATESGGIYTITASIPGIAQNASFVRENILWYVALNERAD